MNARLNRKMAVFFLFLILFQPFASQAGVVESSEIKKNELSIVSGKSHLLKFQKPFTRVSISDPQILDFLILSPRELLLNAKKEGGANLFIWDSEKKVIGFDLHVTKDPDALEKVLRQIDPQGSFQVYSSKDSFVVKGEAHSVEKAKQIEQAANAFAEGSVSLVQVKEPKQILLQTRFVQIDRTNDYDFGADIQYLTRHFGPVFRPGNTGGKITTDSGSFTPRNSVVGYHVLDQIPFSTEGVSFLPYSDRAQMISSFIKALEKKGIVRTIARPNLLAKDGEEASFLVGGEAAIVVATGNELQVNYKEFGTRLKFKPEIVGDETIRLTVEPEVSSLSSANGVTVGSTQVPGFTTTRAKTVVELKNGESFMIGGLLQQKQTNTDSGVPFLRRLPLIGKLFSNMDHDWTDTELIVLVTPKLVNPEKQAISEDNPRDVFAKASEFVTNPISEERSEAIEQYIKHNERYLAEKAAALPAKNTVGEFKNVKTQAVGKPA